MAQSGGVWQLLTIWLASKWHHLRWEDQVDCALGNFVCFFVVKDTTFFHCFHAARYQKQIWKNVLSSRPGWDWILSFSRYISNNLFGFDNVFKMEETDDYFIIPSHHSSPPKKYVLSASFSCCLSKYWIWQGEKVGIPSPEISFFSLQKSWCAAAAWLVGMFTCVTSVFQQSTKWVSSLLLSTGIEIFAIPLLHFLFKQRKVFVCLLFLWW